jgi:hypothetical protein
MTGARAKPTSCSRHSFLPAAYFRLKVNAHPLVSVDLASLYPTQHILWVEFIDSIVIFLGGNVIDFLISHANEIGAFVGGLFAGGAGGSWLTLRLSRKNQLSGTGTITDQSAARAGGDIVGRDKTTTNKR